MGLRDRLYELKTIEQVDQFLERHPSGAFFKAGACHKTMQGFGYVEQALDSYDVIHMGFVRVIECRPVSNYIAELTNVVHQSPQLILFIDRKPVYDVDNWNIGLDDVSQALLKHFGPPAQRKADSNLSAKVVNKDSVKPYVNIIQRFISGAISGEDFEMQWLKTFQLDATLRSTKEFSLLNSLFGDVDTALSRSNPYSMMVHSKEELMKQKAEKLLTMIQEAST